jgi:hypothetical protein
VAKPPVVVLWGGIDAFKEERPSEPYLAAGLAPLAIDMPGVADAPLAGSQDAERLWDAVFDYVAKRPDLDASRVGIHGGSTGGYWATKVAHTHRHRLRAAVNQGGPAHFAFQKDWIVKAQRGEYPFELAETLACAFGRSTAEDWIEYAPKLSRHPRSAVRAAAVRQRHHRHRVSDCRYVLALGSWHPKVGALLFGRPHGRRKLASGDRPVVERGFDGVAERRIKNHWFSPQLNPCHEPAKTSRHTGASRYPSLVYLFAE